MKRLLALLFSSSLLAVAGDFVVYPGSTLVPPMSTATRSVYVTLDGYDKVVAYYQKTGKLVRTMDVGGRKIMFSFDGGVEGVIREMPKNRTEIAVDKRS